MLGWLQSIWDYVTGSLNDVRNWILSIISAVYSYIGRVINALEGFTQWVYNASIGLFWQAWNFASSVYTFAAWIVTHAIPDVVSWAWRELLRLGRAISDAWSWIISRLDWLVRYVESLVGDAVSWIIHNIWDPLWNHVQGIWKWIWREGAYMLYLLTHPDKLVTVLGGYLWRSWLDLLRRYSGPIGRFMARQMLGATRDIANVLELIISAML